MSALSDAVGRGASVITNALGALTGGGGGKKRSR
jgi:hypothetical protein